MPLGETSGMAFLDIISCGKSCHISVNGNVKNARFERKKVCFITIQLYIVDTTCFHNFLFLQFCD